VNGSVGGPPAGVVMGICSDINGLSHDTRLSIVRRTGLPQPETDGDGAMGGKASPCAAATTSTMAAAPGSSHSAPWGALAAELWNRATPTAQIFHLAF